MSGLTIRHPVNDLMPVSIDDGNGGAAQFAFSTTGPAGRHLSRLIAHMEEEGLEGVTINAAGDLEPIKATPEELLARIAANVEHAVAKDLPLGATIDFKLEGELVDQVEPAEKEP